MKHDSSFGLTNKMTPTPLLVAIQAATYLPCTHAQLHELLKV